MKSDDAIKHHQLEPVAQHKGLGHSREVAAGPRIEVAQDEDLIDLREYWNILVRRKGTILTILSVAVVAALLVTFLTSPIFRATLLLQINREEGKILDYQDVTAEGPGAFGGRDFYQTQYELLRSRSLARRVVDQLGLRTSGTSARTDEPSFFGKTVGLLKGLISRDASEDDGDREPDLEKRLLANLTISPIKNSKLVRVSYDSPGPKEAAAVANAIADNFISTNLERRYQVFSYAKSFLDEQTEQLRAKLEDSEQRLVAYGRELEIINPDDRLEMLMLKIKQMSSQLIEAEADRITAEAEYREMLQEGSASAAGVLGNRVIQRLKERKADLEADYLEKSQIYKPGYPKIRQLRQRIAEFDQEIARESAAIATSVKSNFEAKIRREAKLKERVDEIKEEILVLQDRSTDYQTLKREVSTNRALYDGLLQRMKEVGVAAGIGINNIFVVDRAEIPTRKFKPSLKKNFAIAIAMGLFGGVLIAFLFESIDDTMNTSEEVEKRVGVPVLGVIPAAASGRGVREDREIPLLPLTDPKNAFAEAYRSLRTALVFATSEGAPRIMHFTSAGAGEGKTTSVVSTAVTFAQGGSKVLLIDADLRNPSLHQVFRLPNSEGLTNYLTGVVEPARIAQPTLVPRLFAIMSGPLPPNPIDLISGAKMRDLLTLAKERFDYVIIDGPPVLGLSDALVLANLAGATLFVVEAANTRARVLDLSVKQLRATNTPILGTVFTKVKRAGYGYGYGYDYSYVYGGTDRQSPASDRSPTLGTSSTQGVQTLHPRAEPGESV